MIQISDTQRAAIHYFDDRGHAILSKDYLEAEIERLEAENAHLKALLAKLTRERNERSE